MGRRLPQRLSAALMATLGFFPSLEEATGAHPCAHHDALPAPTASSHAALAPVDPADPTDPPAAGVAGSAAAASRHGGHGGFHADPTGAEGDRAAPCTCTGPCAMAGPPSVPPATADPPPADRAPRGARPTEADCTPPRLLPHFHPYANAPPIDA